MTLVSKLPRRVASVSSDRRAARQQPTGDIPPPTKEVHVSITKSIRWRVFVPSATMAIVFATASAWSLDGVAPAQGRAAPISQAMLMSQAIRITPLPKQTAQTAAGMTLGGFTSQRWPVVVDVAKDGRRITQVALGLDMNCTSGGSFGTPDRFFDLPVWSNGSVHAAMLLPPLPASPGSTVSITGGSDSVTGRLDRRQATFIGTWQLHVDFQNSDGTSDHCDSGRVSFKTRL